MKMKWRTAPALSLLLLVCGDEPAVSAVVEGKCSAEDGSCAADGGDEVVVPICNLDDVRSCTEEQKEELIKEYGKQAEYVLKFPDIGPHDKATLGPQKVSVSFQNNSDQPIYLWWDSEKHKRGVPGALMAQGKLSPGAKKTIGTYTTHNFAITLESNANSQQVESFRITKYSDLYYYPDWKEPEFPNGCRDRHDNCPSYVHSGECQKNPGWMIMKCGLSCNACELWDPRLRCDRRALDVPNTPALRPGDLDKIFIGMAERFPQYDITILSEEPWVAQIDGFLADHESAAVLKTTGWPDKFKRSTDQGKVDKYGEQAQVVSKGRTSQNTWCRSECENHPDVRSLIDRIVEITGVPYENYESFQVLQYEEGQFYRRHHDDSGMKRDTADAAGPRILTFYLYFADVEDGGETEFTDLGIKVKPVKGRAILWPSVKNDDPTRWEPKTHHAALPPGPGMLKLGANAWIHLFNYAVPNLWACTGALG